MCWLGINRGVRRAPGSRRVRPRASDPPLYSKTPCGGRGDRRLPGGARGPCVAEHGERSGLPEPHLAIAGALPSVSGP